MSILITGGTKGIGLAIAEAFARDTSDVFLNYHGDDAAAQDAAAQVTPGIRSAPPEFTLRCCCARTSRRCTRRC